MAPSKEQPLVWIDCEMTGLDVDKDEIIEIFCLITDGNLRLLDETGWGVVVHQTKEVMDSMDEWCINTHGKSGLTTAVLESKTTAQEAADGLLSYVQKYVPKPGIGLLAGNSIGQDKAFLRKEPYDALIKHLHYRVLDVSSIKEAAKRWSSKKFLGAIPQKKGLHQAREDILESIEEARYYKTALFQTEAVSDTESHGK